MSVIDRLSLLHGMVPWAVPAVAAVGLLLGVFRRRRRWWTVTLPCIAAVSIVVVVTAEWCVQRSGTVRDHYPPTFGVWIGLVPLAALVAAAGWRSAGRWQRVASLATVPLMCASAFVLINSHYGYWPTVGDLLGRPLADQVSGQSLAGVLRAHDDRSGAMAPDGAPGRPSEAAPGWSDPLMTPSPAAFGGSMTLPRTHGRARTTELAAPASGLHGVTVPIDVPPGDSGFRSRQGTLYLPPAFFAAAPPPLPVVILLGGTPGGPDAWPRSGALRTVDAYASQHHGVAPILAFIDHNGSFMADTECVDGPAGEAETFLAVDVPRFLSGLLHVPLESGRWGIGGFSEGGTCAFELAVRHPDVYGTFLDIAGDWAPNLGSGTTTLEKLYGGDRAEMVAHDPAGLLRPGRFPNLDGWFVVGASDTAHRVVDTRLAAASRAAGITTATDILPGDHTWRFVASAFRVVFPAVASEVTGRLAPGAGTRA